MPNTVATLSRRPSATSNVVFSQARSEGSALRTMRATTPHPRATKVMSGTMISKAGRLLWGRPARPGSARWGCDRRPEGARWPGGLYGSTLGWQTGLSGREQATVEVGQLPAEALGAVLVVDGLAEGG